MKKSTFLVFICMTLLMGCKNESSNSKNAFVGNWKYIKNSNRQDYSLSLKINNDTLKGTHCFVSNNGNKIDCEEVNTTIICSKINGLFKGTFKSSYSNKSYDLTLKIIDDTLCYNLDEYNQLFFKHELKFIKEKD